MGNLFSLVITNLIYHENILSSAEYILIFDKTTDYLFSSSEVSSSIVNRSATVHPTKLAMDWIVLKRGFVCSRSIKLSISRLIPASIEKRSCDILISFRIFLTLRARAIISGMLTSSFLRFFDTTEIIGLICKKICGV